MWEQLASDRYSFRPNSVFFRIHSTSTNRVWYCGTSTIVIYSFPYPDGIKFRTTLKWYQQEMCQIICFNQLYPIRLTSSRREDPCIRVKTQLSHHPKSEWTKFELEKYPARLLGKEIFISWQRLICEQL